MGSAVPRAVLRSCRATESAVLAQWSLCLTGYKRALLNGPGVSVIGVGAFDDGRVTSGDHK